MDDDRTLDARQIEHATLDERSGQTGRNPADRAPRAPGINGHDNRDQ